MRNEYRINYAKKIMQLPAFKNYTIEAIGEASGFGSRTTFFNAFKNTMTYLQAIIWSKSNHNFCFKSDQSATPGSVANSFFIFDLTLRMY